MVATSDIEVFDAEDSNLSVDIDDSASNLSEPRQRSLRRRKNRHEESTPEPEAKNERSTRPKRKTRVIDKEREEFLSEFDQTNSERERRKAKTTYKDGRGRKQTRIYDEKGILISSNKDLCDCMDDRCPGCHFPCPKCRSNKCGHECRQNRKWIFDCVELDGIPGTLKENPYAKEYQTNGKK